MWQHLEDEFLSLERQLHHQSDAHNNSVTRSTSQMNIDFALHRQQRQSGGLLRSSIEKSHSLPAVNRIGGLAPRSSATQNETFGIFSSHQHQQAAAASNPFLTNSLLGMAGRMPSFSSLGGSAAAGMFGTPTSHLSRSSSMSTPKRASADGSNSDDDLPRHLLHPQLSSSNNNNALGRRGGGTHQATAYSHNMTLNTVAPSPIPQGTPSIGPSELYRLIASPPQDTPLDWDTILHRAITHPHEACYFDTNAGGHVFALHKLLRRTGDDPNCRPPFPVVEAVMKACPRAVTRKQAVVDEDDVGIRGLVSGGSANANDTVLLQAMDGQLPLLQQQPPPLHEERPHDNDPMNDEEEEDAASQRSDDDAVNHDDVRFEYPLAIACEWEQDGEVVRLLASSLKTTNPVYRSEVFRSLDYASLPNRFVRILLEENPNCVWERGTSSEENEDDDDDSPLEKVLFWWDDPDMVGMEDDIASYPDCNMRDDLCDLFEKLRMMLYAAAKGSMDGYDDNKVQFQVLHHVLRIVSKGGIRDVCFPNDFAHAVLLVAKFIQRERVAMFQERDETGSLPLHIACSGQGLVRPSRVSEGGDNSEVNNTVTIGNNADAEVGDGAPDDNNLRNDEHDQLEDEEDDGDESGSDEGQQVSGPSGMEVIELLLENNPTSIRLRDSLTGSLPLHLALKCNPQVVEVIEKFIDLFPLSISMPDGSGRLPLHIAILHKSPAWKEILSLYPAAIECRDPITALLPFQLAAMSTSDVETEDYMIGENEDSLSLCFKLLRENPCLATGLGEMKPPPQSPIEQQIMARYKPRVLKLEEENERLQQRVKELENQLKSLMATASETPTSKTSKKRKSSSQS